MNSAADRPEAQIEARATPSAGEIGARLAEVRRMQSALAHADLERALAL